MTLAEFFELSIFILAVLNPVSKVALLASLADTHEKVELSELAWESCLLGLGLLVVFAFAGRFILRSVFHLELYSIEFAGGAAIFMVGLKALSEGYFFSIPAGKTLRAISAAPVGMPMIAGPATIAAVISAGVKYSPLPVSLALVPPMVVNLALMLLAARWASRLSGSAVLGALVRITGLFVAAIGASMMLSGLGVWLGGVVGS